MTMIPTPPETLVMVVDDDFVARTAVQLTLTKCHYQVVAVGSAHEAIELCGSMSPNIILLDLIMPVMDGHEALKRLKRLRPDIPVISKFAEFAESADERQSIC